MGDYAEALRRAEIERIASDDRRRPDPSPREERKPRRTPEPTPKPPQEPARRPAPKKTAVRSSLTPSTRPQSDNASAVKISRARSGEWAERAVIADPTGIAAESYRYFAVRLMRELELRNSRTVLITSGLRHEGKTTTACNLAFALASMTTGGRVALVDLDLRKPSIGQGLAVTPRVGFEQVLTGEASLLATRLTTDVPQLDLFLTAAPHAGAHQILSNPLFAKLVKTLAENYQFVVFDAPPVLLFPDASMIAEHVGACVTVARAGHTRRAAFREMLALIPPERHIGSFLNRKRSSGHLQQYKAYAEETAQLGEQKLGEQK